MPCLILLDLSSAFDTLDHTILSCRLKVIHGQVQLVMSFVTFVFHQLSGQFFKIADATHGVPQGSFWAQYFS